MPSPADQSYSFNDTIAKFMRRQHEAMAAHARAYADRAPDDYELREIAKRRTIEETADTGQVDELPDTLCGLADWLAELKLAVPAPHRDTAKVEWRDGEFASWTLTYERPETDEEWAERKADVERRQRLSERRREESDRASYERLKAKFG